MNNWFECKVSFERIADDGLMKKVNELYLVNALSFTEAEARITEEMEPFISGGEFLVANIKRAKIAELFPNEGDKWFRAKVNFISLDEEKGIEKRVPQTMMVQASTFKNALENLLEGMKNTMSDYEIAAIVETQIMDVYPFKVSENQ